MASEEELFQERKTQREIANDTLEVVQINWGLFGVKAFKLGIAVSRP
jgi:hypothetical protein